MSNASLSGTPARLLPASILIITGTCQLCATAYSWSCCRVAAQSMKLNKTGMFSSAATNAVASVSVSVSVRGGGGGGGAHRDRLQPDLASARHRGKCLHNVTCA